MAHSGDSLLAWLRRLFVGELRRVVLVEFLGDDPFDQQRAEYHPFFQGWVRARGGRCEWVALAAGRDCRPQHPYEVELPPERLAPLLDFVSRARPTLVVFNERLSDANRTVLAAAARGAPLVEPPASERLTRRGAGASPDYDAQRLDPDQPTADHFQHIIVDPRCTYRRSVAHNPLFEGISLRGLEHPVGCSFCPQGRGHQPIPSPRRVLALAVRQFARYHETVPEDMRRRRFLLFVMPMLGKMDELAAALLAMGLPPAELYLTYRLDTFLRTAPALRRALPLLREGGHVLHLWQVGLENYSPEENLRFHKGITVAQADEFMALVDELEAEWPGTFVARAHGGFALILFTPWTSLTDLRHNVDGLRRHRLEGNPLDRRLFLRRGTPLLALAERDGLVLAPEEGSARRFGVICITHWGEDEVPWRFRHPEVDHVYRLMNELYAWGDSSFPLPEREALQALVAGRALPHPLAALDALLTLYERDPALAPLAAVEGLLV